MIEREMKFIAPDKSVLAKIAGLDSVLDWLVEDGGEHPHTDTYYDTPDRLLYNKSIVLRHRKTNASSILSFKARGGEPDTDIFRRIEISSSTDLSAKEVLSEGTRLEPFNALYEYTGTDRLELSPVLIVNNRRHILYLLREEHRIIEISLDTVEFTGSNGRADLYEVELESLAATDFELRQAGGWFAKNFGLEQSGPSKYIWGMDRVGGAKET